jgi:NAD(P)-dependent dehydrogenase (short-subunit alcohol dehydrogenase family)
MDIGERREPARQDQTGASETSMTPRPTAENTQYRGSGKLARKVALITGGDSGIGRAVAIAFAKEGADISIVYLRHDEDAEETRQRVEREGRQCVTLRGDLGDEDFCRHAVDQTVHRLGKLSVLVNNAGEQEVENKFEDISSEQLERTFRTNIFGMFFLTKAALKHLPEGGAIVNTTSVTAYRGNPNLVDYSASKGAIVAFTRSLSKALVDRGIRVNAVAPGPIWTPLIPSTFPPEKLEKFGKNTPMKRPGQPEEVALSYVFLASDDSSYTTGQVLHPNGGEVING